MNALVDFLSFRTLISGPVLVLFYYLGALGMPLAAWWMADRLLRRYAPARDAVDSGRRLFVAMLPTRHRILAVGLFLAAFLFMELLWRMMFEYLIAFMQIRDALVSGQ